MKNLLLLAALLGGLYLVLGRGTGGKEEMSQYALEEATPVRQASADKRIRVILFTGTEWCPACSHLDSSVIATAAWQEFVKGELVFQKVDVPSDRSRLRDTDRTLISRYGISGYPTMIVLDRRGRELSRQVGSGAPVENYKEWIRRHTKYY